MARILALDEVPVALRNHLVRALRSFDEAVLLPQAERREEPVGDHLDDELEQVGVVKDQGSIHARKLGAHGSLSSPAEQTRRAQTRKRGGERER